MVEFSFADWSPPTSGEVDRLEARQIKLAKTAREADKATTAFGRIPTGKRLLLRKEFVWREEPAEMHGEPSDRRLPPPRERPPATRLASPRGIALKLFLAALFVAQSRSEGERPANTLPVDDRDAVSWVDLIATPAEPTQGKNNYTSVRDKKLRQLQHALGRLSDPEVQLVTLPNLRKANGKYEGFLLLHEGGAPYGGGENDDRYTVPKGGQSGLLRLPPGLFHNGWIHALEDSELAFLLMIAFLHSLFGSKPVFAAGEIRLLRFGLGRDAYQAHQMLRRFGLVDVHEDESRHIGGDGKVSGFDEGNPAILHRFNLLDEGFDELAFPTISGAINRRIGKPHISSATRA